MYHFSHKFIQDIHQRSAAFLTREHLSKIKDINFWVYYNVTDEKLKDIFMKEPPRIREDHDMVFFPLEHTSSDLNTQYSPEHYKDNRSLLIFLDFADKEFMYIDTPQPQDMRNPHYDLRPTFIPYIKPASVDVMLNDRRFLELERYLLKEYERIEPKMIADCL